MEAKTGGTLGVGGGWGPATGRDPCLLAYSPVRMVAVASDVRLVLGLAALLLVLVSRRSPP